MDIERQADIEHQAIDRKKDRLLRLTEATAGLPQRKTGELSIICKMAEQAHKTLCTYDLLPNQPALAGITETWFDAALERIAEIKAAAEAA